MTSQFSDHRIDTTSPAIILGFTLSGLGVVRSLARYGVDCWILYNNPEDPALKTRFGRKRQIKALSGQALAEELAEIFERTGERAVLFPTSDTTVEVFSRYFDKLQPFLHDSLPSAEVLQACMKKNRLEGLYEQAGIVFPKTANITLDSRPEDLSHLQFPCILKPSVKSDTYTNWFEKAYFVESPDQAILRYSEISTLASKAILQEYLTGPDSEIFFCLAVTDKAGVIVQNFIGRKLASWPPFTGSTAACIPAPEVAEELTELTQRFFRASGFFGIGSLEFKYDPDSGRYFAIEPTVSRVDTQSEIAVLNGVNLPMAYYCLGTKQHPPPIVERPPVGWVDSTALAHLRRATRTRRPLAESPVRLVDAMWRPYDPGPWLELQRRRLLRAPRALAQRLLSRLG